MAGVSARPRCRAVGIEVDPNAIRRARLEAGLSLAQVAGPELSRQAVQHDQADAHFEQAVAAFERAGYPRRLEECLRKWQAMRTAREPA